MQYVNYPRSPHRVRRVRLRVKQATAKVIPAGRCTHALGGALERLAAPPRQQALRACELAQIGFASPSGWLCQAGMSRGRPFILVPRMSVRPLRSLTFLYEKGPKQKAVTLRNSLTYCQKLLRNYLNFTKFHEM